MKDNIYIGIESHGQWMIAHPQLDAKPRFPTLEFSFSVHGLPELTIVSKAQKTIARPVWRVTISDFESEHKYFLHSSWALFVNALDPLSDTLILSLERTCEYEAKQLDTLREIIESLYPLRCFLEFEHHSWSHGKEVLLGAKRLIVQHDSPELPGIIKDILPLSDHPFGKHSMLRLLGRNKRTWFEHRPTDRFAYQYSNAELSSIAKRIYTLREETDSVTVIVATHPAPSALETAINLTSIISK
jgi:uncharacterized protein YecE (DUF72 family)